MYGLIIGITIFICVLLVLIVLVQNPKGGGLASSFSSSNQFMGVKRTADFIEKTTWGLAAGVIFLSVIATMLPRNAGGQAQSRIQEQIENTAADPGERLPAYPTVPTDDQGNETPQEQTPQQ
ncbi:MAG TPA: preprotein translocase subunit SecG [Bacteroidales bacterium]|nr:preprotein translocase subunit SecG [Bacteroidales bacterium]